MRAARTAVRMVDSSAACSVASTVEPLAVRWEQTLAVPKVASTAECSAALKAVLTVELTVAHWAVS